MNWASFLFEGRFAFWYIQTQWMVLNFLFCFFLFVWFVFSLLLPAQDLQEEVGRESEELQRLQTQRQKVQEMLDELDQQKGSLEEQLDHIRQQTTQETQLVGGVGFSFHGGLTYVNTG